MKKIVKIRKIKLFFSIIFSIGIALSLLFTFQSDFFLTTNATSVKDDNTGTWFVDFKTSNTGFMTPGDYNNGIATKSLVGSASLANAGVPGFFYTTNIQPTSSLYWKKVTIDGTWSNANDVKVGVYDCTNGEPFPDQGANFDNTIPGFGNPSGLTYTAGGIDISAIPTTVKCIKIKTYLGTIGNPPVITKISATWEPLPVLLINHSAEVQDTVGNLICFQSKVSLSYATDNNLVLVVPLPNNITNPGSVEYPAAYPTPGATNNASSAYFQDANRTCGDIANMDAGGTCTSTQITGDGTNGIPAGLVIPANSIYWKVSNPTAPTTVAGSSLVFNHCLNTQVGWQNNIEYHSYAFAKSNRSVLTNSDLNLNTPEIDKTTTTLISKATTAVSKTASGVVNGHVNNDGGSNTYTPTVSYTMKFTATGTEDIFNPVVTDDVTDILTKLASPQCGSVLDPASRITFISNNGVLTGNTIKWNVFSLQSGITITRTIKVNYAGCEDNLVLTNKAQIQSDNTSLKTATNSVIMGVDLTPPAPAPAPAGGGGGGAPALPSTSPKVSFAKGDRIKGVSGITANRDDNLGKDLGYNDSYSYYLSVDNRNSAVAIGNVVMIDKIPSTSTPANASTPDGVKFVSASLPTTSGGTIYYHTGGAANSETNPPNYNATTGVLDTSPGFWTTTPPAVASDVKWIAFVLPCVPSPYSKPTTGICVDDTLKARPSTVNALINVQLNPPTNLCTRYTIPNTGNFAAFKASSTFAQDFATIADIPNLATPIKYVDSNEPVSAVSGIASFNSSPADFKINTSATLLYPKQTTTYSWFAQNTGTDSALNTKISIDIPSVQIDGIDRYLDVVSTTGGGCTLDDPALQSSTHKVSFSCGTLQTGQNRSGTVAFMIPYGIDSATAITVNASLSADDDNLCAPIKATSSSTVNLYQGKPIITEFKKRNLGIIPSGDDITYQIDYSNIGDGPSTNTFVIDRLPVQTTLKEVYTGGTEGIYTYDCPNCIVYYSDKVPPLYPNVPPSAPLDKTIFLANFVPFDPSWEVSPGKWVPPQSVIDSALYIGFKVDLATTTAAKLGPGKKGSVGFKLKNDDNNILPGTGGSPAGTVITNYPAIFSDQNLLAIANEVSTTILPDPGILMSKRSIPENVVAAGEEFDWIIDYKSNSGNPTVNYVLRDTLPTGIIYLSASNTWNSTPASLGALAGTTTPLTPIITNNPDGTTGVEVNVTGPLRGGNILKDEGGHITLHVKTVPTATSNTRFANNAIATYDNGNGNLEYAVSDDITVQNTDVTINKLVDKPTPIVGETVGYTIKVSNRTELDAKGIKIEDTLPAGICYVPGSTRVITTGWVLPEPSVSPQVCNNSQPTTLTWNNVIDGPNNDIGVLPGMAHNSLVYTEVIINYSGKVNAAAVAGTSLTNNAKISTLTPEDNVFPNTSNVAVTIPKVDLSVQKTGNETLLPGDDIDYSVSYSNYSKQFASNVYLIDTLPNAPKMKLVAVNPNHGELICYSNAATKPAFVSGGGCAQTGWSATLLANASFVAIDYSKGATNLAGETGPFNVTFSMRAVDPVTNVNLSVGTSYTNGVEITTTSGEDTLVNNAASITSKIPAADMAIKKTGSSEGTYPGLAPGDTIKYTFEVSNLGTVDACNVTVTDAFPTNLTLTTPATDYTSLSLVDVATSNAVKAHNLAGDEIVDDIPITFTSSPVKFTLGGTDVCFPPQSKTFLTLNAKINPDVADNTIVTNKATVSIPVHEDIISNNTDDTNVTVYKADVLTSKDGISCGKDDICGNADDSQVEVNPGESIRYKVKYDNLGNIDAKILLLQKMYRLDLASC